MRGCLPAHILLKSCWGYLGSGSEGRISSIRSLPGWFGSAYGEYEAFSGSWVTPQRTEQRRGGRIFAKKISPFFVFTGLEPLPHLASPGSNPFRGFCNFTPAWKPPVEDNGRMLPTPGVRGFYWRQNPDLSIRVEIDRVETIKYGARNEDLFI